MIEAIYDYQILLLLFAGFFIYQAGDLIKDKVELRHERKQAERAKDDADFDKLIQGMKIEDYNWFKAIGDDKVVERWRELHPPVSLVKKPKPKKKPSSPTPPPGNAGVATRRIKELEDQLARAQRLAEALKIRLDSDGGRRRALEEENRLLRDEIAALQWSREVSQLGTQRSRRVMKMHDYEGDSCFCDDCGLPPSRHFSEGGSGEW